MTPIPYTVLVLVGIAGAVLFYALGYALFEWFLNALTSYVSKRDRTPGDRKDNNI